MHFNCHNVKFYQKLLLEKKKLLTYFQSKIRRHHNFLIWVLKYCIQENYVCYNFCRLSGSKAFFFSKYKLNFGQFWPKNSHPELYFLVKYSLNQLKLSYPPIWYPRWHIYINFFYLRCMSGLIGYFWPENGPFLTLKWPFWPKNGHRQKWLF